MTTPRGFRDRSGDGLLTLVGEVPELVRNLVVAEYNSAKTWVAKTAKDAGIGVVWFLAALFVLFWSVPAFGTFLIAGLASWMPVWLSALLVFFVLIIIVVVLALLGVARMKRISKSEDPLTAAKTNVKMVKDIADEL